jgi:histidinol-phosphate aminotransferase
MNPLLRWVTKIIHIFRPASIEAPETKPVASATPTIHTQREDPHGNNVNRPIHGGMTSRASADRREPVPPTKPKRETKPLFTGRVEITPDLDNPARLRQINGVLSITDIANRELLDLVPYEPGKPVDDVARELGLDPASIIKLASNENPLGPSPLAVAAMRHALESAHFYPDGGGFHLRNAIAKNFNLGRGNVVLGNGSNEIIELLFHTFTRPGIHEIITARHAFAVYTLMAQLFGVHAIVVDDVNFTPDLPAMLRAITPQTRLIFLASPNNPTGTRVSNEALAAFLRELPAHVIAVLDEAYYEFLDDPPDTVNHVRQGGRIVLMRTFSKIQGLAGLRIGYGLAPAEIADLLQRARQPFNANSIAQAGAMAGLADTEHQRKTKAITDEGRRVIEDAFARMGLKYVPSSANFVLVQVGDGGEVFKRLMKKGIIVRSMVSYHLPEYIRVSIGTPEQNARFLAELPAALDGLVKVPKVAAAVPSGGASASVAEPATATSSDA